MSEILLYDDNLIKDYKSFDEILEDYDYDHPFIKPNLLIEDNDIEASHSANIAPFDEEKLFFVSAFEPRIMTELQLVYNLIGIVAETPSLIDWILKANTNQEVMGCLRDIMKMM